MTGKLRSRACLPCPRSEAAPPAAAAPLRAVTARVHFIAGLYPSRAGSTLGRAEARHTRAGPRGPAVKRVLLSNSGSVDLDGHQTLAVVGVDDADLRTGAGDLRAALRVRRVVVAVRIGVVED